MKARKPHNRIALLCVLLLTSFAARAAQGVDVTITGLDDPLKSNVQALLSLINDYQKRRPPDAVVRRLYARAPEEIGTALQPFGYYQPRIDSSLTQIGGNWQATFHIDPGPPTLVQTLELRVTGPGQHLKNIQDALAGSKLAVGQRLIQPDYDNLKNALLNAAQSAGYLDAHYVEHKIAVRPEQSAATIHLVLATGPRYYFGPITVEQDILAPTFVQKFNPIETGDVFSTNRLLELELALRDSEYFSRVTADVRKEAAHERRIPVILHAKPSPSARYMASVGYGTDTGPRVGVGVLFRHLNRQGHQFSANARISAIKSTLTAQYKIPVGNVRTDFFAANATAQTIDINDAHSKRADLGVELNQMWLGGRRRLYLDYDNEHFYFGGGKNEEPHQTTTLVIPGITYTRKRADSALFPRNGYQLTLDAHGAAEPLLSDTSYIAVDAAWRSVYPLGEDTRLLLYAELGAIKASDFRRLPPTQRFFTGGARTVRGYGYQELAPRDARGNIVGGRYLAVGSIEVDHLFIGNFGGAIFLDAGNVANHFLPELRRDVGIGLRYRTPIGMVRLDVARTLNDPNGNHWHLQISIGPYF
ncbi:MAG TPA: autotransporter assembly complex family protein [Gammaproteobacteria bacterium]|nr:autotransporter assembly complex family protein [Gammaproteobacteria bacterium]